MSKATLRRKAPTKPKSSRVDVADRTAADKESLSKSLDPSLRTEGDLLSLLLYMSGHVLTDRLGRDNRHSLGHAWKCEIDIADVVGDEGKEAGGEGRISIWLDDRKGDVRLQTAERFETMADELRTMATNLRSHYEAERKGGSHA